MWKKGNTEKKRKKKARKGKGSLGVGGMILFVIILFAIVTLLLVWIEGRFAALDRRLTETSKQVQMISAAKSSAPPPAASTETSGSAQAPEATEGEVEEEQLDLEKVLGRIVSVKKKGDFYEVTLDPAQLLTGKAASSIAAHRGKVPVNGRFIDDEAHSTRAIHCSVGALVTAEPPRTGETAPKVASELFEALEGPDAEYWRTEYFQIGIDSDYIVSFEQFRLQ